MRYPALLVSDPHFTANARDEYRWGLFPWLRETVKDRGVKSVVWLGDLSDAKDFHPSSLVNRLAREFALLMEFPWLRCYMIPGNHEWLKRGEEYWRFLAFLSDRLHYFTQPSDDPHPDRDGPAARFLPFTKTPGADWAGHDLSHYDLVFMHQTVGGARSSNGEEMQGEDVPVHLLREAGKVWSGDIHVPQRVGCVEYVGSPYHVHFGDSFRPRCVLLTGTGSEDLRFATTSRVTIDTTADLEGLAAHAELLRPGDQVKVRVHIDAAERHEWKRVRREALDMLTAGGLSVHGMELIVAEGSRRRLDGAGRRNMQRSPPDDLLRFVQAEELGAAALDVGLEMLG